MPTVRKAQSLAAEDFCPTQSRIIGAVRRAHSQLWGTTLPVYSPYALRKYDKRFGTPAIV